MPSRIISLDLPSQAMNPNITGTIRLIGEALKAQFAPKRPNLEERIRAKLGVTGVVALTGPPLAGKGTISGMLAEVTGFDIISSGEILRRIAASESADSEIRSVLARGDLISDTEMYRIISAELSALRAENGRVFDGFPRTVNQARWLVTFLQRQSRKLTCVIELHAGSDYLLERMYRRGAQEQSDDTVAALRRRLEIYTEQSGHLNEYWNAAGQQVITIDTECPREVGIERVKRAIDSTLSSAAI